MCTNDGALTESHRNLAYMRFSHDECPKAASPQPVKYKLSRGEGEPPKVLVLNLNCQYKVLCKEGNPQNSQPSARKVPTRYKYGFEIASQNNFAKSNGKVGYILQATFLFLSHSFSPSLSLFSSHISCWNTKFSV